MAISSNYTDLLLKKYLGVVETSLSNTFASEAAGNARPNVFTNQLYNSPIPNTAPSGPLSLNSPLTTITITSPSPDLVLTGYVSSSGSITSTPPSNISFSTFTITPGVVYTSKTYPYIQYIQHLPLSSSGLSAGTSYRYTDPTSGTNILQNMIPFNYDPAQSSFKNYLYTGNGNNYINTKTNLIDQKYYLIDCDAGYLMFINGDYSESSTGSSPLISFYRYNGAIGIPTNLGSFAGAYNQNVNALAYGSGAGQFNQATGAIAIGFQAGQYSQGTGTIGAALAIGYQAGVTGQNTNTVAVGFQAGNLNQGTGSIAVGYQAGSIVPSSVSGSTGSAYLTSGNFPLSLSMYSANTFSSSNTISSISLPLTGSNTFTLSNTSVVPGMITNIGTSTATANIVLQNASTSTTITVNTTTKTGNLSGTFTYPSKIVMSANGQYQLGSIGNTVYLSTNSGVTFRSTTLSTTNLWTSIAMSGNGQYMIAYSINTANGTTTGSISSNYGSSWSPINTNAGLGISSVAICYTGQYIITVGGFVTGALNNFVNVSSNFGSTFSRSTLPSSRWVTCSMSSSGQYMLVGSTTTMYLSTNFGLTFSIISSLPTLVGITSTPVCWYTSYVSGNGQCMIAVTSTYVYYISTNYGATWVLGTFTIESSSNLPYFISLTNTSQFLVAINPVNKSTIYLSPSYKTLPTTTFNFGGTGNSGTGKTIQLLSLPSTSTITSTAISSDGTYLTLATTTGFYTVNMNSAGNSVALGYQAGQINQAINTVAIGSFAGQINQHANTIVLNASGTGLNTSTNGGLFAAPINPSSLATSAGVGLLGYSSSDSQIVTVPAMFDSSSDIITLGNYAGSVTGTTNNSIILNASGTGVGGNGPTGGFYVAPIGSSIGSTGPFTLLAYGSDRQIVSITGTALTALGIGGGGGGTVSFGPTIQLGTSAGSSNQANGSIAIGFQAGQYNQGSGLTGGSIAIGYQAGVTGQNSGDIAIGFQAGQSSTLPSTGGTGSNILSWTVPVGETVINSCISSDGNYNLVTSRSFTSPYLNWSQNTSYATNTILLINSNPYIVITSGTSGSVAPTSTSSSFTDGTLTLAYLNIFGSTVSVNSYIFSSNSQVVYKIGNPSIPITYSQLTGTSLYLSTFETGPVVNVSGWSPVFVSGWSQICGNVLLTFYNSGVVSPIGYTNVGIAGSGNISVPPISQTTSICRTYGGTSTINAITSSVTSYTGFGSTNPPPNAGNIYGGFILNALYTVAQSYSTLPTTALSTDVGRYIYVTSNNTLYLGVGPKPFYAWVSKISGVLVWSSTLTTSTTSGYIINNTYNTVFSYTNIFSQISLSSYTFNGNFLVSNFNLNFPLTLTKNILSTLIFNTYIYINYKLTKTINNNTTIIGLIIPSTFSSSSLSLNGRYGIYSLEALKMLYVSSDYCNTWISPSTLPSLPFTSVYVSPSGQNMYVCAGSLIYNSSDYGVTWSVVKNVGTTSLFSYLNFDNNIIIDQTAGLSYTLQTTSGGTSPTYNSSIVKIGSTSLNLSGNLTNTASGSGGFLTTTYTPPSSVSFSIWFYVTSYVNTNNMTILSLSVGTTNGIIVYIGLTSTTTTSLFLLYNNFNSAVVSLGPSDLNKWNHVCLTLNNTNSSPTTLYFNGNAIHCTSIVNVTGITNLYIGYNAIASMFSGYLDDFRIYNGVLSPAQVWMIYNNTMTPTSSSPLYLQTNSYPCYNPQLPLLQNPTLSQTQINPVVTQNSGLIAWFDASTLGLTDGVNVTSWQSRSSGYTFSSTGTVSPVYRTNNINGLGCVNLVGANCTMSIPSFSIGQTMSVFMVSQSLSTSTQNYQNGPFLEQGLNANSGKGFYLYPAGGAPFAIHNGSTSIGTGPTYNPIPVNTISIDAGINPDPSNTNYITYYKNGTASSSTSSISTTTTLIDTLYLNNRLQNAANIAEIMIFNIALTASQRREVEGYLAVKWGISSLLPITHPYYTGNYSIGQLQYIMSSAFSTSLNYQLCVYSGSMIQVSSYGTNFTTIPSSVMTASNAFSAVSSSGQYMVVCIINALSSTGPVYYSSDFGSTWSQIQSTLLSSGTWTGCSISSDGSYITITDGSTVYTINSNISINSVAIGYQAGQQNQGQYSIAIGNGAGQINQPANSIVMNATSSSLNGIATVSNGCFIAPIASSTNSSSTSLSFLGYGSDNQVVQLSAILDYNYGLGLLNNKGFYVGSKTDNYTISGYSYSHYSISWASVSGFINTDVSPKCFISGWAGMSLITGGVSRLVIDSNGKVGIGSTASTATGWISTNGPCLQIINNNAWTGDQFNITSSSSDTAISLINNYSTLTPYNWRLGVGSSISGGGNGNFYIYNGTSVPFTIGQNGRVGVGVTNPGSNLSVTNDIGIMSGTVAYLRLVAHSDGANYIQSSSTINSGRVPLHFTGHLASGSYVTIDATGNLGVGTFSPGTRLHVYNSVDTETGMLIENNNAGGFAYAALRLKTNSANNAYIFLNSSGKTNDGPALCMTIRNDAGDLRLQSTGGNGIFVAATSGNVGINTASPGFKLDVNGSMRANEIYNNSWFRNYGDTGLYNENYGCHFVRNDNHHGNWRIWGNAVNSWNGLRFSQAEISLMAGCNASKECGFYYNNVGWGLYVDPGRNLYIPGDITAYWSDRRLKTNLRQLLHFDHVLTSLTGYTFNWNEKGQQIINKPADYEEVGLIAQDVQAVIPQAVKVNKAGISIDTPDSFDYLTINYDKIVPFLIEGYKAQRQEIKDLQCKVERLEELVQQLLNH